MCYINKVAHLDILRNAEEVVCAERTFKDVLSIFPPSPLDSYPKTKPPPLLSLNILQGSPPPPHGPTGTQAPSTSRGHPPPPHGPSASETRSLLYGPPPLHGHPAPHSSSAFRNPHPLTSPTAPRGLLASHATPPPRPYNGPHGFHIHAPPQSPHGPPLQNGPSGLRAPPPLLRNLRMRNPAGLSFVKSINTKH